MERCKHLIDSTTDTLKKQEKEKKQVSINHLCSKQKGNRALQLKISQIAQQKFNKHFPANDQCHFSSTAQFNFCPYYEPIDTK